MEKKLLFLLMIFSFILSSCSDKKENQNTEKIAVKEEESKWGKVDLGEGIDFAVVQYLNTFQTKALMISVDKENNMYVTIKDKEAPNIDNGIMSYLFDDVEMSALMHIPQKIGDNLYTICVGTNNLENDFVKLLVEKNNLIIGCLIDDNEKPYILEIKLKGFKDIYNKKYSSNKGE